MISRRAVVAAVLAGARAGATSGERPNILWITTEDISLRLGCYGDPDAATPQLDRFAAESVRYTNAYAAAPVCSPSRSCLITGVFANTLGSMHLRGMVPKPTAVRCFPELLREAGYYTSNDVKEDYNFDRPAGTWDESSNKAHWRERAEGQPFFSVFNLMTTHQGQIRYSNEEFAKISASLPASLRRDPSRMRVPPYFPDTPEVRLQLAILYTQIAVMDQQAGGILRQLEQDGLAQDTIVFFFGDNGTGIPRGKRFLYQDGIQVPLLVRFPAKYRQWMPGKAGSTTGRLVSFVDFAPTVLGLCGLKPPTAMQGHAFLGPRQAPPRTHVFAARDRVDEEFETSRAVTDGRWKYIRNYTPHRPVLQHGAYSEMAAIWQALRRLEQEPAGRAEGDTSRRSLLAQDKPAEELYDLRQDPRELRNLAGKPAHRKRMDTMRGALHRWMLEIRDTGLLPEAEMMRLSGNRSPASLTEAEFPVQQALEAAENVGRGAGRLQALRGLLKSPSSVVRYWGCAGLRVLNQSAAPAQQDLAHALQDESPSVRIMAAEALVVMLSLIHI